MRDNINKVTERGANLDTLRDKSGKSLCGFYAMPTPLRSEEMPRGEMMMRRIRKSDIYGVFRRRPRRFCTRIPTRCQQGQEADVVRFAFPVFSSPSVWPKQPWRWLIGSSLYRVTRWKDMKWRIIVGVGIAILIIVIVVPIVKA